VTALALGPGQAALWWIALAVGLVVVAVVIALLTLLSRLLSDIVSSVGSLNEVAEGLGPEAAGDDLAATAASLRELRTEIKFQEELLARWTQHSKSS